MDKLKNNTLLLALGIFVVACAATWWFFVRAGQVRRDKQKAALIASSNVLKGWINSGQVPSNKELAALGGYKKRLYFEGLLPVVRSFDRGSRQFNQPFGENSRVFTDSSLFFTEYRSGIAQLNRLCEGFLKKPDPRAANTRRGRDPNWEVPQTPPEHPDECRRWQRVFWIQNEIALIIWKLRNRAAPADKADFEITLIEIPAYDRKDKTGYFSAIPIRAELTLPADQYVNFLSEFLSPRSSAVSVTGFSSPIPKQFTQRRNIHFGIVETAVFKNNDILEPTPEGGDVPGMRVTLLAEAYDFYSETDLAKGDAVTNPRYNERFARIRSEFPKEETREVSAAPKGKAPAKE